MCAWLVGYTINNDAHSDTSALSDKLSASNLLHNKFELYVISKPRFM